jgi:hypothetical protein
MTPISTDRLKEFGFSKNGQTYTMGLMIVKYDGVYWYFNGEKIKDNMDEIKNRLCTSTNL